MRKSELIVLGIILISFIVGFYFYSQMPEKIVMHWNAEGQANGYMPKFFGLFLMPFIFIIVGLLFIAIPSIDPWKENIEKFRNTMMALLFCF